MKIFDQIKKACLLLAVFAVSLTACNKLELEPTPNPAATQGTTPTLATLLDAPEFSLLKTVISKADLLTTLSAPNLRFTLFAPDNAAITRTLTPILPPGVTPEIYINNILSVDDAKALVKYNIIPQEIGSTSIPNGPFSNLRYPSLFNPLESIPAAALFRMQTFPSKRGSVLWVNNIPLTASDIHAVNGIMHKVALIVMPPKRLLWNRIDQDTTLSYFKAAIQRADPSGQIQGALSNPGANFTVMAPVNNAVRPVLFGALYQGMLAQGVPQPVAFAQATALSSTPEGFNYLPVSIAGGIVLYHMFDDRGVTKSSVVLNKRPGRVFSINIPAIEDSAYTFLNSQDTIGKTYYRIKMHADFSALGAVTAATVRGASNATASNFLINPTPDTVSISRSEPAYPGTSDQQYINGILHKIDQVLLPPQ